MQHACSPRRLLTPPRLAAAGTGRGARQAPASAYARHFARLLENQGNWEAARGHFVPPFMSAPQEAWEGLGQHAPELAEVAVGAADVASSLQYFEVRPRSAASLLGCSACWAGGAGGQPPRWGLLRTAAWLHAAACNQPVLPRSTLAAVQAGSGGAATQASESADAVARLSAMLASAAALVATDGEGLTPEERRACCLDAAAAVKQEPIAGAAAAMPQSHVLGGQPPAAPLLPFGMAPQQQGAAQAPAWQLPQAAGMLVQQPQQALAVRQLPGMQLAGGMLPPGAAAAVGWPGMQLPANGQQQQQLAQQAVAGMQQSFGMQQPVQQQFAGMMPQQQWAMPGMALPTGAPGGGIPLAPGVTGATVQQYLQVLQQKPAGGVAPAPANGTQH